MMLGKKFTIHLDGLCKKVEKWSSSRIGHHHVCMKRDDGAILDAMHAGLGSGSEK